MPSTKLWLLVSSRPSLTTLSTFLALLSLLRLCWEVQCRGEGETLSSAFGRFDMSELEELHFEVGIGHQPVSERILSSDRDAKVAASLLLWASNFTLCLCHILSLDRHCLVQTWPAIQLRIADGVCFYQGGRVE